MRSRSLVLAAVLVLCAAVGMATADPARPPIHIGAIIDKSLTDVRAGIDLGLEEMGRTANLLGREVRIHWVEGPAAGWPSLSANGPVLAIITAGEPNVTAPGANPGVPVLDLSPRPSAVPADAADHWTFRVRAEPPGTEWTPELDRFGAGELNERYERRTGRGMSADAWVGWVAVKAIVEAALRSEAAEPAALADALRTLRFDAHKGEPLYFDGAQRLVQPVY